MRLACFALLAACATSDDTTAPYVSSELGDSGAISVIDGDLWYRTVHCPSPDPATCVREAHFWVDLAVRNDAYEKQVGIVWIDTIRPTTWRTANAVYEGTNPDGTETWGVDVTASVIGGVEPNPHIQFAAFVHMAGVEYWDNNQGADHDL
jgi:hypothetical protein